MTAFRLSSWQLFLLVFFTSFCVTPFGVSGLHAGLGRHIWLASLAQALLTMIGSAGVVLLFRRWPKHSLRTIAEAALGPAGGRAFVFLAAVYIWVWGPVGNLTTLLRMIQSTQLPDTAPLLIAAVLVAVGVYGALFGPEIIGRASEFFALPMLPALAVLSLVPHLQGEFGRLLPLSGAPADFWFEGEFWTFALGLRGFILALALAGAFPGQQAAWPILAGGLASSALVTLLSLAPHTVFDTQTVARFQFPTLETMDAVNVSAFGVQSFLTVTMTVWHVIGWVVTAATLFTAAQLFAEVFGIGSGGTAHRSEPMGFLGTHRTLLLPLAAAGLFVAGYPRDAQGGQWLTYAWNALGMAVGVAGPWLLWAVTGRSRPERRSADS